MLKIILKLMDWCGNYFSRAMVVLPEDDNWMISVRVLCLLGLKHARKVSGLGSLKWFQAFPTLGYYIYVKLPSIIYLERQEMWWNIQSQID